MGKLLLIAFAIENTSLIAIILSQGKIIISDRQTSQIVESSVEWQIMLKSNDKSYQCDKKILVSVKNKS